MFVYTESGRNSEQIINTNDILLKVINGNFSTYNLLPCLNLLYIFSLFVYNCLLGGHSPPECTGAHELRSCALLFEAFLLKCWLFRLVPLICVYLSLQGVYCTLYFSNNPTEKNSGAVRSGEWGGRTSPKRATTRWKTRRSAATLITAVWDVAPSCWNHRLWCGGSFGARNSFIISVLRCDRTVRACPFSSSRK